MKTRHVNTLAIFVAADACDAANDAAVSVVGETAGRHTFIPTLSDDGKALTRAYAGWSLTSDERDALEAALAPLIASGQVRVYDASEYDARGEAQTPAWKAEAALQAEGLRSLDGMKNG